MKALGRAALAVAALVSAERAMAQSSLAPSSAAGQASDLSAPLPAVPGGTGLSNPYLTPLPNAPGNASTQPNGTATAAARKSRRQQSRRSRSPTSQPFQAPFRPTLIAPDVEANIQPVQTGLPDPASVPTPVRKKPPLDDPYAPLGIRAGNILLFPVVGESIGYDSNPNRTQFDKKGSFVSQTEGELRVQSDWSRHELTGYLRGAYDEYPSNPEASRPEGAGKLGLRLDVSRDTQVNLEGHYQLDTQRPDSPDLNVAVRERPIVSTEGASVGVTHSFDRLVATLQGTYDRTDYQDATLADGTVLDQGDRNLNQYGLRARLGYEFNPGFIPFVEGRADTRVYDRRVDDSGYMRSSDALGARVGTTFELTRLITGEVSLGADNRHYDDPRLRDLTSPVGDLALNYALTPLTTIRATAQASVDETTIPGANGVQVTRGSLEVVHALRRNLTLTAGVSASENDYKGVDITERGFGAMFRADYSLTRQVAVRASYNYENLRSSVPGSSYVANVFLLGIRLQP